MSELQHDTEKDENHTVLESIVKALAKGMFCSAVFIASFKPFGCSEDDGKI